MTIIESKKTIGKPVAGVYSFLADLNNHQQLMPENIYNWSSTATEARFTIQNMAKLALKVGELIPNQSIQIIPAEAPPFEMELKWLVTPNGDQTEVTYRISADLNMMMKMLASGPLQKLADHETSRLAEVLK
ncbi:orotate phosphoribosyltransferase [Mucilaginibacter sp. PPCGB 2223]|uniref:orotate phosphoribosyltransferase n=1 Tax=Mucilaginibacter sp. PPCGB 2223 TaxID=1886027 RepID=UPI000825B22F|nr:orotate phosphoribosyltransferase [Mucilaginibacter sp. PPCGB 2223]OCX53272.1 orotate phosphoribosyltransferase [Mucilaginibacter sp. PPCGB 2223]